MTTTTVPSIPMQRAPSATGGLPVDHGPYLHRAVLSNGLRVAIRGLRPEDRDDVRDGFGHLSPDSRFRRFLGAKPVLTARDLNVLIDGVDQHNHFAVVLVWPRTSQADVLLGVARFVRLRGRADTADVAVTVADEIQGRGAGKLLMRMLATAALDRGITRFSTSVLPSNEASYRLIASVGTVVDNQVEMGCRDITVRLAPENAAPSAEDCLDA